MDEQKRLRFCAEVARQRILAADVPEYAKQTFELMLDAMPEVASLSEATCREWVKNAARATECSLAETQVLIRATTFMYQKPQ